MRRGVLAVAGLAILVAASGCTAAPDTEPAPPRASSVAPVPSSPAPPVASGAPTMAPPPAVEPYAPQVGDCFDVRKAEPDLRESLVPCEAEHDDEVYAEFRLPDGAFPGDEAAHAGCTARFGAFIGVEFADSVLEITTYHPSATSWADGDRRVACAVWNPTDTVVGTLAGSGI
ncbi:hypothetical protein GE115_03020 [Agromyces sp. CFH 90414]|uniref:Septum formation-related domain-containing protein n=1 Tax=Agromyces agglutinans TaxID=2662258 RepID=A0A6I2F548_9MICO|nr:septum formation family protein [Agromyces agglutinans]MRG58847.1 hypothetical protein [Agromyces agglutinans]